VRLVVYCALFSEPYSKTSCHCIISMTSLDHLFVTSLDHLSMTSLDHISMASLIISLWRHWIISSLLLLLLTQVTSYVAHPDDKLCCWRPLSPLGEREVIQQLRLLVHPALLSSYNCYVESIRDQFRISKRLENKNGLWLPQQQNPLRMLICAPIVTLFDIVSTGDTGSKISLAAVVGILLSELILRNQGKIKLKMGKNGNLSFVSLKWYSELIFISSTQLYLNVLKYA